MNALCWCGTTLATMIWIGFTDMETITPIEKFCDGETFTEKLERMNAHLATVTEKVNEVVAKINEIEALI